MNTQDSVKKTINILAIAGSLRTVRSTGAPYKPPSTKRPPV
ncbi:MAG: hypothetical protein ACI82H_001100 [Alphaproteobacteria bacterium]|jgi:hypothetical protein